MAYSSQPKYSFDIGFSLIGRIIAMLALLTGVMYISAVWIEFGGFTLRFLFMVIAAIGLLIGLRWSLVGGLLAIIAGIFLGWEVYRTLPVNQLIASTVYCSPFIVGGTLYLIEWIRSER